MLDDEVNMGIVIFYFAREKPLELQTTGQWRKHNRTNFCTVRFWGSL